MSHQEVQGTAFQHSEVRIAKPSTLRQYRYLLGKDLRREFRTFDMLMSMVLYSMLVLTVFGAALSQTGDSFDILQMAGGLLWVLVVFTSLLGLNRSFAYEKDNACIEGLMLVPMDRAVIFLAKMTSNFVFLTIVEVIALPFFYFFFLTGATLSGSVWLMAGPLLVGSVGIAGIGTLLSTMTANTRGKDVILAVLFIPLIFPLLYACVSATTAVICGTQDYLATYGRSLIMAGGYDAIMVLASWALYDFVVSS